MATLKGLVATQFAIMALVACKYWFDGALRKLSVHPTVQNGADSRAFPLIALILSVPWSLRPRNRAAAATCGRGRCDFPAILMLTPKIASG